MDPGHGFVDTMEQLCGTASGTYPPYPPVTNSGFVASYFQFDPENASAIMHCYAPEQLPILTTLAQEFAVCDRWFSSMPGPTWPNRFFVHAASSAGLDDSPSPFRSATATLLDGYKFDNGTIFDRLDDAGYAWRIYHGDQLPQSLAINGMVAHMARGRFKDFEAFAADVSNPAYPVTYTFIEPNYGNIIRHGGDFTCGDSQHPKDDVTRGERLLKTIYEAIRNSPLWESSVLVITYDEHGGFYDHVLPPQTVPPGDSITDPANDQHGFDFTQLGGRVPTVIVSPLIPRGLIDHTIYDHTSVLATIEQLFGLAPLTDRDRDAQTFQHLLTLPAPRTDAPTHLPAPARSGLHCEDDWLIPDTADSTLYRRPVEADAPVDPTLQGFLHVAFLRGERVASTEGHGERLKRFLAILNSQEAVQYMDEVRQKIIAQDRFHLFSRSDDPPTRGAPIE
jgi:phospholipase C